MKRFLMLLWVAVILSGCKNDAIDKALNLRKEIQNSNGCSFDAVITADYGDVLYEFELMCQTNASGELTFTVMEPESISGITGVIGNEQGVLTFDDEVLAFSLLADGQITPVNAPWILMKALRGGYINAGTNTKEGSFLEIDDSYEEDALQVNIWLNETNLPYFAEIYWSNRKIISINVSNFTYL